jgi:hypothetical protein
MEIIKINHIGLIYPEKTIRIKISLQTFEGFGQNQSLPAGKMQLGVIDICFKHDDLARRNVFFSENFDCFHIR